MPIARIGDGLHFFAHVPKCAGTSVEQYLETRFGPLAFVNRHFLRDPEAQRWSKSSPQHIPLNVLRKLVPETWIASSFAVVRHPAPRLISAFTFQASVEGLVPDDWTVNSFFDDWLRRKDGEPFLYDGHLLPQSDLVPEKAAIFRLEDGLDGLVAHLDGLAGNASGARKLPVANVKTGAGDIDPVRLTPSPETTAKVARYYAQDFARFDYGADAAPYQEPKPPGLMQRVSARLRR